MDWIDAHTEVALAIASALFAVVGYWYRARREKHENLREALYLLLELWHRAPAAYSQIVPRVLDRVIERFKTIRPDMDFSDEDQRVMRTYVAPILENVLRLQSLDGVDSLYSGYEKVVHLISRSDPVLAYDLDAASETKRRLAIIDQYLAECFKPMEEAGGQDQLFSRMLSQSLKGAAEHEVTQELEEHLRRLAWKLGPMMWSKVALRIGRRKKQLKNGPDLDEVDKVINILLPFIEAADQPSKSTGNASVATIS